VTSENPDPLVASIKQLVPSAIAKKILVAKLANP